MENAQIAAALETMGDLLELTEDNPFKVRAYRRASETIEMQSAPVVDLWRKGELGKLPGIGARTVARIGQLIETGTCDELERLRRAVPPGVREMLALEGVGLRTVTLIWKELGITDLDMLEEACRGGDLEELPGIGPARSKAIAKALARHRARSPLQHSEEGHA
ncbi:MAG TPA: helix-hairpin-helix domain-containing protein [Myxococcaceae bacterium]|jgi:DNA polymerase (family 10)